MMMHSIIGNTRRTDIVFHKSGRIDISALVAKEIGLKNGDVIDIMVDGVEWYIYIKHHSSSIGRHRAAAFATNVRGKNFRVWSKTLCNAVLKECNATDMVKLYTGMPKHFAFGIAIPIITKNPKI